MLDGTISKLQVILKMSKISLKEIRTWEREKMRKKIAEASFRKYWLYEKIIREANIKAPYRMISFFCN